MLTPSIFQFQNAPFYIHIDLEYFTLATRFICSITHMLQHVASCVLFRQHKSTYYKEVSAKHFRVHLTIQNQFHILFLQRQENLRRQSSTVQKIKRHCYICFNDNLCKADRKCRCMKNCLVIPIFMKI